MKRRLATTDQDPLGKFVLGSMPRPVGASQRLGAAGVLTVQGAGALRLSCGGSSSGA